MESQPLRESVSVNVGDTSVFVEQSNISSQWWQSSLPPSLHFRISVTSVSCLVITFSVVTKLVRYTNYLGSKIQ